MASVLFFVCFSARAELVESDFTNHRYMVYESETERDNGNYWILRYRGNGRSVFTEYRDGEVAYRCKNEEGQAERTFVNADDGIVFNSPLFCRIKEGGMINHIMALIFYLDHDVDPDSFDAQMQIYRKNATPGATSTFNSLDVHLERM